MSELKPCPFCGSKAKVTDHGGFYTVGCTNLDCAVTIDLLEPSEEVAAADWNRRAQPASEPLTLEQLRKMYDEPVWVVCGIYADWRIPEFIDEGGYKGFIKFTDRSAEPISDYGKKWIVYRRKPEGSETDAKV